MYTAGRRYVGLPADEAFGPGKTQWGRVMDCARKDLSAAQVEKQVSEIFAHRDEAWSVSLPNEKGEIQAFSAQVEQRFKTIKPAAQYSLVIRLLAREITANLTTLQYPPTKANGRKDE